eukprot:NODE_736_length_1382_cov_288.365341_g557_i0.p1 GENE.NODE_736_length_1382_cov_288.365341_g557_i0~~NODE_736_length_1382_cov_288.365341_g557_i0.p1  ORF type:complete len:401 (-),score=84.84 NODE_736_length_1382_cov_288.365341_g557_i0:110-1312(-)
MKGIMRVILNGQEHVTSFVPHLIPILANLLTKVSRNPQHPTFNHYLFESLSGIVKFNPSHLAQLEQTFLPIFTNILGSDTPEFMPYVFQIFAQMLEQPATSPANYLPFFGPLLTPSLYENKGNIPALVRLLRVYLEKAAAAIVSGGHLTALLGVFQYLVTSKLYDHEGFNLLNTIIAHVPKEQLGDAITTIFNVLLQRLMQHRTSKFVKCLLVFFSLFALKLGPDTLVQTLDSLQAGGGLFKQVYNNVYLREVQKVSGGVPRKLCCVGLTKFATESNVLLSDACFAEMWSPTVVAILKMIELGEEADAEGEQYTKSQHTVTVEQLRNQEQGYMNAYCPLAAASKTEEDPCAHLPDERTHFANCLQTMMQSSPAHAQKCLAALKALPADVKTRLPPFLGAL